MGRTPARCRYGNQRAAVVLYAAAMAVAGALLTSLTALVRGRRLMAPDTTPAGLRRGGSMTAVSSPSVAPLTWMAIRPIRMLAGFVTRRSGSAT